jgi:hypothetical protein
MKRPTFFHGVIVAAVLGFLSSAIAATLTPLIGLDSVIRLVIPSMALAYVVFLLSRSGERLGRVSALTAWTVMAALTWWAAPTLPLYLLIHVSGIWILRSLYFYSGVLPSLMDLGISALGVCAAIWAITRSGNVFLATWCFFLVQAAFVAIPASIRSRRSEQQAPSSGSDRFETARRQADQALRQLFTQ